ncbi:MAG: lysylphosphatidylglycerol synthase transmembrane domain-containing protein [bacterium]|nr:lysylphosphatidylglycerol synthase transmembrane domain-containing protein [bacterium]
MTKPFVFTIKIAVSVLLLQFLFFRVDYREISSVFYRLDIRDFFAAFAVLFLAVLVGVLRWRIFLSVFTKVSFRDLALLNIVGLFYSVFLPGGALTGEAVKFYKSFGIPAKRSDVIFSILMDKATGFIAFALLGMGAFLMSSAEVENSVGILMAFAFCVFGSVLFLLLFYPPVFYFLRSVFDKMFGKSGGRFKNFCVVAFSTLLAYVGKYKILCVSLLYGLVFQFLNCAGIFIVAKSLHLPVSFLDIVWVYALVSIILFVPASIMGLGLREVSFVYLLGLLSISAAASAGLSFVVFLLSLSFALLGGVLEVGLFAVKRLNLSL